MRAASGNGATISGSVRSPSISAGVLRRRRASGGMMSTDVTVPVLPVSSSAHWRQSAEKPFAVPMSRIATGVSSSSAASR